jgi:hypothetical protein
MSGAATASLRAACATAAAHGLVDALLIARIARFIPHSTTNDIQMILTALTREQRTSKTGGNTVK